MTRAATTSWQRLTSSIKDCFGGVRWVQTSMESACELHSVGVTGRVDGHRLAPAHKINQANPTTGARGLLADCGTTLWLHAILWYLENWLSSGHRSGLCS